MTPKAPPDHFSAVAADYARVRPTYPPELFAWLTALPGRRDRAWDCGTGSGQAALGLAGDFDEVIATDQFPAQLAHAPRHPRIVFREGREDESGIADHAADLVVAAQAFHWFDGPRFFAEVERVLRPGGALALVAYGTVSLGANLDAALHDFLLGTLGPDWPPERALVDTGYRDVVLPFAEVAAPAFTIRRPFDLDSFAAYLETTTALRRHRQRTGRDPLPALVARLRASFEVSGGTRVASWPVSVKASRRT